MGGVLSQVHTLDGRARERAVVLHMPLRLGALLACVLAVAAERPAAAAPRQVLSRKDHRYEVGEQVALYANKVCAAESTCCRGPVSPGHQP